MNRHQPPATLFLRAFAMAVALVAIAPPHRS